MSLGVFRRPCFDMKSYTIRDPRHHEAIFPESFCSYNEFHGVHVLGTDNSVSTFLALCFLVSTTEKVDAYDMWMWFTAAG